MQPGVVLTKDDAPVTPDPKEQKTYRSFVGKIQFVVNSVRYDVSFAASQLARFCASAAMISRHISLGCIASCDRISKQQPKFQTRIFGVETITDWIVLLIPIGETVSHVGL